MKKLKLTVVACTIMLWAAVSQGQATYVKTIQLHFATGKYVLTKEHKKAIMDMLDSVPKDDSDTHVEYHRIVVNGHTDNEGDAAYNLKLSERRADAVSGFLLERGIDVNAINKNYYGEAKPVAPNNDASGKQLNRRVDISITYSVKKASEEIAAINRCSHDTLITTADGARVSMSICDYERTGGDFQVNAVLNGHAVRESGLNTMGDDGTPLMSGGMFNIKFKNDSCLKKPITVFVPVDTCVKQPRKMMKYVYNYRNGRWTRTRVHIRVVKQNGKLFYAFNVQCPGMINLDCPQYFAKGDLRQFVTKNGLTLIDLKISNDCPCSMLEASIKYGGHKAYGWVSAKQPQPMVSAKVIDKNGDTLTMPYKPLSSLLTKGKKQVTGHFLWVFPIRKTVYYDKYCIRRSDFDVPLTTAAK